MGERAPIVNRERRIRNGIRGVLAGALVAVALLWLDPVLGRALASLVVFTLVVMALAVPRGWDHQAQRAFVVVPAIAVVGAMAPTLAWWQAVGVVALLGPAPFFAAFTVEFVLDEIWGSASDRVIFVWAVWLRLAKVLRTAAVPLAWLLGWRESGDLVVALATAPAAVAAMSGHGVVALVLLAIGMPFAGGTVAWWAVGGASLVVALGRRRARPPRRAVGLPVGAAVAGHPVLRFRLWRIDRRLMRADWRGALDRCARLRSRTGAGPGPAATSAAIRVARAHLEQDELQATNDALAEAATETDGPVRAAARRLEGEALARGGEPRDALVALAEARALAPDDEEHQARVALAAAEALVSVGQLGDALVQAERAAGWFRHRAVLMERFRAARLVALAAWQLDDLERALAALESSLAIHMSVRWLRQYIAGRDDQELVFGGGAALLTEWVRLDVLERRILLDPRVEPRRQLDPSEALDDLEMHSVMLDLGGAGLDRAEVDLLRAEILATKGDHQRALESAMEAISDLDGLRYSLRAQAARAAWAATLHRALGSCLDLANACGDSAKVAELIEMARVQAFPVLGGAEADRSAGDVALLRPPTVRIHGRASIARGLDGPGGETDEPQLPPIDLERAAASAVGPGGWWLSYWHDGTTLTWALVPPEGQVEHGRIQGDRYDELIAALAELDGNLPIPLDGESDGDVDFRLYGAPFCCRPADEAVLSGRLGRLLLPERLRREALARRAAGRTPLRVAIAPDPLLAHVPWALLVVDGTVEVDGLRLVEVVTWALAPSATLLVLAGGRPAPEGPAPLRLAVLDPADVPELPAARALVPHLLGVRILGGRHWQAEPATLPTLWSALRSVGRDSTVLFGCHAVRGDARRPSDSALVLAAADERARSALLTAADLLGQPIPPEAFPAQVSLRACDTSDLASATGGEWLSLAPAFLAAGARVVGTTQFPLVDVAGGDRVGGLVGSLLAGTDLADALRREQLDGLARWRAHAGPGRPPLEDTPLAWAAHAVCSTGRAGHLAPAVEALHVSSAAVRMLLEAAKVAGDFPDRTVTSAHLVGEYVDRETELLSGTLVRELSSAALLQWGPLVLRARRAAGPAEGVRPSAELLDAARRAGRVAAGSSGWLEAEHIVQAVMDGPRTPGRRLLAAVRLRRGITLRRELLANLRKKQLRSRYVSGEAPAPFEGFVDEMVAAALEGAAGARRRRPAR